MWWNSLQFGHTVLNATVPPYLLSMWECGGVFFSLCRYRKQGVIQSTWQCCCSCFEDCLSSLSEIVFLDNSQKHSAVIQINGIKYLTTKPIFHRKHINSSFSLTSANSLTFHFPNLRKKKEMTVFAVSVALL